MTTTTARHPACPVCTGAGAWDAATGVPTRPGPFTGVTKCLYCQGSGRCPVCEAGQRHPREQS